MTTRDEIKQLVYRFDPTGWRDTNRKMEVFYDCSDGTHVVKVCEVVREEDGYMIADALNRRAPSSIDRLKDAVVEAANDCPECSRPGLCREQWEGESQHDDCYSCLYRQRVHKAMAALAAASRDGGQ